MSDLAASGGYYIAMPAQVIVAQPSTLTGSIGIFGGKFVTGGVYEKLGAHIESTSIGTQRRDRTRRRVPTTPTELKKLRGAAAVLLRRVRREGRRVAAHARRRRSTRWRRGACGPGGRRSRTGWSTSSAASIARSRSPSSARRFAADSDVELVVYPPRKSFYELLSEQFSGSGESRSRRRSARGCRANLSSGEIEALRDRCAARSRCSAAASRWR